MKKKNKIKLPKIGNRTVKNNFEYDVYKQLVNILGKNIKVEYETEQLEYTVTSNYMPDFILIHKKDGTLMYIEAKGNGRAFDHKVRQKMIAVKEQHPDKDIRIIFYSDGKIGPKRKDGSFLKQSDWATKNGFKFAIRYIPKEWFNE